jgi:membrane-bound lytic murein transglycosylase D
MNIYKSTVAAAKYFKALYILFDNWELALCAYNSGENRVKNAIAKGGTRDYLQLVELGLLPKETILYVPKIVAMRHIERNLEKYNITDIEKNSELFENAVPKTITKSFNMSDLKIRTGMSDQEMLVLNPDLKKEKIVLSKKIIVYIPKRSEQMHRLTGNEISLPKLMIERAVRKIAAVSPRAKVSSVQKKSKLVYHKYIVKKGDNLHLIAKKFKISTKIILSSNSIKNNKILKGQSLKIPKNQKIVQNI